MPLPALVMPDTLPMFLLAGYAADYRSPYGLVTMGTGHALKRRLVTRKPNLVSASLLLDEQQAIDWHAWHRDSLRNGERSFSLRTQLEGGPLVWYEAQVVEMYQATMLHLGRKRIDVVLRLIGAPSVEGPNLGEFSGTAGLNVTGSASLQVLQYFSGSAGLEVS